MAKKTETREKFPRVFCPGCKYFKDCGRGTCFCNHPRVRMLSQIRDPKPCVWREAINN